MKPAPQTLAEALEVIRAMHSALLDFRHPEFDLIAPGREGEFDDRVKAVLAHSAPVINADRHASDCAQHNEPAMPAGPCDCGAAPTRVTDDQITRVIVGSEFLVFPGTTVTVCLLTLANGAKVIGYNYGSIDPARQNWEQGKQAAYEMAREKVWELEGYALRERLAAPPSTKLTQTDVQWAEDLIRQLPADHEGRNSWLMNFGSGH